MTKQMRGIEEEEPLLRGAGSRLESAEPNFAQNAFWGTGRAFDYAIEGRGFFALMNPTTGEFTYTRDGSFVLMRIDTTETPAVPENPENPDEELNPEDMEPVNVTRWYLSDGLGNYVLNDNGRPIEVESPYEQTNQVGDPLPVGIFDFINYNGMTDGNGTNGFTPVDKNGQVMLGSGKLVQGYLELSNTDYAYEMTRVIESQRSFQYMIRMIQTSDEITTTVNGLR